MIKRGSFNQETKKGTALVKRDGLLWQLGPDGRVCTSRAFVSADKLVAWLLTNAWEPLGDKRAVASLVRHLVYARMHKAELSISGTTRAKAQRHSR